MLNRARRSLTACAAGLGVLTLSACGGVVSAASTPAPTVTVTATATPGPGWDFWADIDRTGLEFGEDYLQDLHGAYAAITEAQAADMGAELCGTAMDDGLGEYNPASQTDGFLSSSFYRATEDLGDYLGWDVPKIVAYHNCPSRLDAVLAVQALRLR